MEYNSSLNIYIDTDNGKLVEMDEKEYYTFPMFKTDETDLQNVLFETKDDGSLQAYFIKYNVTPEEFNELTNEEIQNLDSEYQKILSADGTSEYICVDLYSVETEYNSFELNEGNGNPSSSSSVVTFVASFCNWVEGQGNSIGIGGGGTGGNTSGGHTGGGTNGGVASSPTGLSPEQLKMKDFVKNLTDGQEAWYVEQPPEIQNNVTNYLISTNFSLVSKEFIIDCINEINEDPNDELNSITPFLIEKQIDDSELDPCSKSVLNELKGLENNDIKDILSRLNNPNTVYKTTIKTEQYPGYDLGQTTHPLPNKFVIKIRTNYVDGTDHDPNSTPTTLSIASTIIHEILHAHLHSLYDDYNNGTSSEFNNFPLLFDAYVSHTYPGGSPVDAQHEVMANSFVNLIASALQEFQTGIPVIEGQAPSEVYLDMAWGTFSGTPIFNHLFPNTGDASLDIVRNRILNRRFAEARNQPIGDQIPIGTPCN